MLTKRELVKSAIAHKEVGQLPYCVTFTPEGISTLNGIHYKGYEYEKELPRMIGNCIYTIKGRGA